MKICKSVFLIALCIFTVILGACSLNNTDESPTTTINADARVILPEDEAAITEYMSEIESEYPMRVLRAYSGLCSIHILSCSTKEEWLEKYQSRLQYILLFEQPDLCESGTLISVEDGTVVSDELISVIHYWHSLGIFYPYITNPERLFGASVEVYEVYCVIGGGAHDGDTVYYVTDHGDYILHKLTPKEDEVYLAPVEILREMYEKEESERDLDAAGAWYSISGYPGIEAYIIDLDNPPEFPPLPEVEEEGAGVPWQWILPGGAVLIVGIAAAAYLGIRKRNANKSCE